MPTSNDVKKDTKKLIDEISQAIGWRVVDMTNGHYQVVNPDGDSVTTSGTPGQQSTLLRFRDDLKKHLGWDAAKEKRRRQAEAKLRLEADRAKNDAVMAKAVAEAKERHCAEMERLKQTQRPGTKLPNGEVVDYISKPVFFTRIDAIAALETKGRCDCNLRALSETNITRLFEPMHEGDWMYMPHGLDVCIHGNYGDGAHRLEALKRMSDEELIELYGEPGLWFRVTYGVPPEVLDNTDMGKARSHADVLMQHGYKRNPKEVAAALNILIAYDAGTPWRHWSRKVITHRQRLRALKGEYAALVAPGSENTIMTDALRLHKSRMKMTLTSALVFCFLIQREVPYPVWNAFLTPLLTLKDFEDDDPRGALYTNLIKKDRKPTEARQGIRELGMALKTWNKWATGERQELATFKKTEPMPRISKITREIPALASLNTPFNG